jgi:ParB-like chromosome segregation protein Spo0J
METNMTETRKVEEIIWREDLYPRFEPVPAKIQEYAEVVELLPPVEINQNNELIDGYHRWTAHRKINVESIKVQVTKTKSDADLLALAYERNASFGISITLEEKKTGAIKMYADGTGRTEEEIAKLLHVKTATVLKYLADTKKANKRQRNRRIWEAWLACDTEQTIAEQEKLEQQSVAAILQNYKKLDGVQKSVIFSNYQDEHWKPPLYNVWAFAKSTNKVKHAGNTEARIVDNLLYLYTEPFNIVIDPFGGGGSTIDVCKKRLRRYWVSDRLPLVERLDIRKHDIKDGPPSLYNRWANVDLLYLDPPYWRQALDMYGDSPDNLANMELEDFYGALVDYIVECAKKMHAGTHVALVIQPTQWNAPDRQAVDHIHDLLLLLENKKALYYRRRISVPYSTEQYNAQQVDWAKENKELLEINREIIVWEVV